MSVLTIEPGATPADEEPPDTDERHRLTALTGLAALSLDAMASVAYGPEAIVLVLAAAGAHGLGFTLPVTLAIAGLLAVLVASYRQVIAAFPDGGGSYAVARDRLGARTSLVAAASLVLDYVLNVAVARHRRSGRPDLGVPELYGDRLWLCLAVLVLITGVNLRGIMESARAFIVPTAVFVVSILVLIAVGLLRSAPVSTAAATGHASVLADNATTESGALLLLKAFAAGCSALAGVEALANAVPSFRVPRVRRAQRAEVALGAVLGVMLIGLSVLISRFHLQPVEGVTVLAQLADASLGHNWAFYVDPVRHDDPAGALREHLLRRPARAAETARPRQLPPARLRPEGRPTGPPSRCARAGPRLGGPARLLRRRHQHPGAALRHRRLHRLHDRAGRNGPALAWGAGKGVAGQGPAERFRRRAHRRLGGRGDGDEVRGWRLADSDRRAAAGGRLRDGAPGVRAHR